MKKILIIHHHGKFGGSSKSISEYINLLKKKFDFEIISPFGSTYSFFKENKFKVYGVKGITNFNITEIGIYKNFRLLLLLREFYYLLFTISIFFKLRNKNYDLIHLNDSNLIILCPLIKFFFKKKIICHVRTRLETNKYFLKPLITFLIKKFIDKIICIDQTTLATSYVKSKSIIIHNIFKPKKKNKTSNKKFNIGFIGTLDFHKGIDFLFECIKDINKINAKIYFMIGGDISIKNDFLSYILNLFKIKKDIKKKINLEKKKLKNVKFLGRVKNLENFYQKLSLVVFPSRMNALGRPIIEAGSFGIPSIVCLNSKKFSDTLIHNKTGYITSFGNKKKFVEYIIKLYQKKKLLKYFGKNSKNLFLKTHNTKKNVNLMYQTYNNLIS
jgi:glycosyltransferase involved in cell wall biosynthesis